MEIIIIDGNEVKKPDPQVKTLGWHNNECFHQETNLNNVMGAVNMTLNNSKPNYKDCFQHP